MAASEATSSERESWPYRNLEDNTSHQPPNTTKTSRSWQVLMKVGMVLFTSIVLFGSYAILSNRIELLNAARVAMLPGTSNCSHSSVKVPQYFQTSPELWAGPTATGRAPFLAQTNPVFFEPTATFVPNHPLETAVPITGQGQNESIFHLMGHLSPYFSNPSGFGYVDPTPSGTDPVVCIASGRS